MGRTAKAQGRPWMPVPMPFFKSHDYAAAILNLRQSAMRRA